ncbi:MAG: YraN family protein [Acidimicrobiia bacterium]|nr:YraN family protein [Acidimicrobiia bacterium]
MASGSDAHRLGRAGEELAAEYFVESGYVVVARNWRGTGGEIDLVLRDVCDAGADCVELVICEVKTRATDKWGGPAEAVTADKQARLRRLAGEFIATGRGCGAATVRFDVVEVIWPDGSAEPVLHHLRDAF